MQFVAQVVRRDADLRRLGDADVGAFGSIVLAFFNGTLNREVLTDVVHRTALTTAMIFFIFRALYQEIYKGIIPFVILQLIGLGLVVAYPEIALWLPEKMLE